jgi:hypothetical protein
MKLHPWVRWVATALVLGLAVPAQAAGTLDKIRASKDDCTRLPRELGTVLLHWR